MCHSDQQPSGTILVVFTNLIFFNNQSAAQRDRCHTPIPSPTRLADPNRFRGARPYTGTLYLIFFLKPNLYLWVWPTSYNNSKYYIQIKRTTTGVVSIKIYTHLPSLMYIYKTELLHLQIRARNLHVVNPYKCVGPAICGCLLTSSPVPTRIKNPC